MHKTDISSGKSPVYRIGILLIDGFALLSYASFAEPLRAANQLAGRALFGIRHLPVYGASSRSSGGAIINANAHVGENVDFDLVMVIAGGDPIKFRDENVFRWLRQLASRGVRLGAISGGPVILARAGLMKGHRMTVHWEHAAQLEEMSSAHSVEPALYIMDRDRITCAGGTAPMDMMHVLISEQHGEAFAGRVSEWFMHTQLRPPTTALRSSLAQVFDTGNPKIILAIEAMNNHISDTLTLQQLAASVRIGPRQLNRIFSERMQKSTMGFYRDLRLEKAREMLAQSQFNLTEIALATGFSSSAHFSTAFKNRFGSNPKSMRNRPVAG